MSLLEDFLFERRGTAIKLGLDRIQALLDGLGRPERACRTLVVGGTNGKGSVATLSARALQAAGRRVGLYTSPHVRSFSERIRIDGAPVELPWIEDFIERNRDLVERIDASFFEVTTAMALAAFREAGVEVAVLEVGMGGRLDATNVSRPEAVAITSIARDHERALGHDLVSIAGEKYAISRPGRPLILGPVPPEVARHLEMRADADGVPLYSVEEDVVRHLRREDAFGIECDLEGPPGSAMGCIEALRVSLPGEHQMNNASVACRLLDRSGLWPGEDAVRKGFAAAEIEGRFHLALQRPFPVVVDVAHNPAGVRACAQTWRRAMGALEPVTVFAALGDKNIQRMLLELCAFVPRVIVPPLNGPRALAPEAIVTMAREVGLEAEAAPSVEVALARGMAGVENGDGGALLCLGSFHLAGSVYRALPEFARSHEVAVDLNPLEVRSSLDEGGARSTELMKT